MPTTSPLLSALRSALLVARKRRDADAIAALRTTLAAIANAEAVPTAPGTASASASTSWHVAGTVEGLGAAEAPRRMLSEDDVRAIVVAELTEREAAAARYRGLGHAERADRLIAEADALRPFTDQASLPEEGEFR